MATLKGKISCGASVNNDTTSESVLASLTRLALKL
jgi:hypothetical protein